MTFTIILFFLIVGGMRVIQKVCSKKVSNLIDGSTYFHYGGYYQLLSAVFSLIALFFTGFYGFNGPTFWYAVGAAACTAIVLFTEIEALKGSSLIVGQMFDAGSIVIPCLFGHFVGSQPMSVWQWLGLLLFMIAMYLMLSQGKETTDGESANDAQKQKISPKTLLMLLIMWLAAGCLMIIQNEVAALPDSNDGMFCLIMFSVNALVLYICYLVQAMLAGKNKIKNNAMTAEKQEKQEKFLKPLSKTFLICGAFLALALFAINLLAVKLSAMLSSLGQQPLLFPLSAAIAIIVTMLVGRLMYKEKMLPRNVIGMVLSAISVIIIAVCTV